MTKLSSLLFRYLIKEFLSKFLVFFFILLGIVYLFDTIELIRRASGNDGIFITDILALAFYKLPSIGHQLIPFITLWIVRLAIYCAYCCSDIFPKPVLHGDIAPPINRINGTL